MQVGKLTEAQLTVRFTETWRHFRLLRAGAWERTVTYYIQNAGEDPWVPTPGQLIAAADRSARDPEPGDDLTADEKARLRRETLEWAQSPEVKALEQKILNPE